MPRKLQRPAGSNCGDCGPDDQRARLNLLTPEKVRQGIAEAREGYIFKLSLPLHEYGLLKSNIHLGELRPLTAPEHWLRQHRRYRFLPAAPPS